MPDHHIDYDEEEMRNALGVRASKKRPAAAEPLVEKQRILKRPSAAVSARDLSKRPAMPRILPGAVRIAPITYKWARVYTSITQRSFRCVAISDPRGAEPAFAWKSGHAAAWGQCLDWIERDPRK